MDYVYTLEHNYIKETCLGKDIEEIKLLGIFSTRDKAKRAIEMYIDKSGFKKHPLDCFQITKYKIGESYWTDGFGFDD